MDQLFLFGRASSRAGRFSLTLPLLAIAPVIGLAVFLEEYSSKPLALRTGNNGRAPAGQAAPPALTNHLGMKFVLLPAGEFTMGSPNSEEGRQTDERRHRVRLTHAFYLGIYEVTVGQFRRFVEESQYRTVVERSPRDIVGYGSRPGRYSWRDPGFPQEDDQPVVMVAWTDATEFCRWLSAKERHSYRLPTEAEWEYACRAGTTTRYSTGEEDISLRSAAHVSGCTLTNTASVFVTWKPKYRFTAPVGQFEPNAFGLYDMHGNVWEWCSDWYAPEYPRGASTDPQGPPSGKWRVIRGGSYYLRPWSARSANRDYLPPSLGDWQTGFRVAMDAPGAL